MNEALLTAALTVLFGAIAGGVTNSLAIWMLFHPHRPPRLRGRSLSFLQGAIPKNKARLAAAIGRTVGNRLLTPEDLARTLAEPGFRSAFDERLDRFLTEALEREWGPAAELLPEPVAAELAELLDEAATGVLDRLDAYLAGEEFREAAADWTEALADELRDEPLGELLTPEREAQIAAAADRWIADAVSGPGLERAIRDYLDRTADRLLEPGRTFEDVLPTGLVAAFERGVAGYLPLALERLGNLLEDPGARARVERVLHEILDRFMRDLRFHQRVVAALVIPADAVDRVLEAIEAEGAARLSELLHDPALQSVMARSVNSAVVDFLRRPVTSVVGRPGESSVEEGKETVVAWALALARDEDTRRFLVERLQSTLSAAERRTWGDLFRHVPPRRLAEVVTAAARSERARSLYREAAGAFARRLLARPIGRPADHLPPHAAERIRAAVADPLWDWAQRHVPELAQRVDVAGRVERKVLEYPIDQLEALIRGVTDRELKLIVRLGYVLGAIIGAASAGLNLVL